MMDNKIMKLLVSVTLVVGVFFTIGVFAATDIAGIADQVSSTFESIGKLMAATAYVAGFGLTIAAIFKFKQHKDNPQQVSMGTAITMLLVGVALIFLPNIIQPAGTSIFGEDAKSGGFTGSGIEIMPGASEGGGGG